MKKCYLSILAAMALVSCQEKIAEPLSSDRYELNVEISGLSSQTRVSGAAVDANEEAVNNLQVFVFRTDGRLDTYKKENGKSLTVSCSAGTRDVYAVVNAPDYSSSVTTKAQLLAQVIDLENNQVNSFVMIGSTPKSVQLPGTKDVKIDVSRLVARVGVKKITREMLSPALASQSFTIEKIYLKNVAGTTDLGLTAAPAKWYNVGETSELPSLLSETLSSVAVTDSHDKPHYFYALPNDNSVKKTMIVIEAKLGEQTYFYPIEMPALKANTSYEIANVTIKRPGSDSSDTPVTFNDISFTVSVKSWTPGEVTEQII